MTANIKTLKLELRDAFSFSKNFRTIYERRASNYAPLDGIRAISIIFVLIFHTFFVFERVHPAHTL